MSLVAYESILQAWEESIFNTMTLVAQICHFICETTVQERYGPNTSFKFVTAMTGFRQTILPALRQVGRLILAQYVKKEMSDTQRSSNERT